MATSVRALARELDRDPRWVRGCAAALGVTFERVGTCDVIRPADADRIRKVAEQTAGSYAAVAS